MSLKRIPPNPFFRQAKVKRKIPLDTKLNSKNQ